MATPLMPKATAVWLLDHTSLSFEQIAEFCGIHILEVQAIADGEVGAGMVGFDPIANAQLTLEEIERCSQDSHARLQLTAVEASKKSKGAKYMPLARRHDRPDAIAWIVKNHPEITDAQIARLVGTTKPTIGSIRDRTHWNISSIKPRHPVTLGLCTQKDLDVALSKAAPKEPKPKK